MIDHVVNRRRLAELEAETRARHARMGRVVRWNVQDNGGLRLVARVGERVLSVPIGDEDATRLADEILVLVRDRQRKESP